MTDNASQSKVRRKSRVSNPQQWKQTVRKRLRQSGQSYINTSGVAVPQRCVRPPCGSTCRLRCSERFTKEQRQYVHERFWLLSDEKKNYFYWKYTSRTAPKKRRPQTATDQEQDTASPRREYTFHYSFELNNKLVHVCSKFFFATLDITSRRIYYFYEHHYDVETCTPRDDCKRGLNPKPSLPNIEQRMAVIRSHIRSSSATAEVQDLSIAKMYKSYAETIENPLKRHWYYKACKEQLQLRFGQRKKTEKKSKAGTKRKQEQNEAEKHLAVT